MTVTRHELAQAMRRGREMSGLAHVKGRMYAHVNDLAFNARVGACALGFAFIAAPTLENESFEVAPYPCCFGTISKIDKIIVHLNDGHEWTVAHIADWLDGGLEQNLPQPEVSGEESSQGELVAV